LIVAGAIYFAVNLAIARIFIAIETLLTPHLRPRPS
jgi:hypothetical protein